jgi:hypothetical protein
MMKSELYKEIVQLLADYMMVNNIISTAVKNQVQDDIDLTRYEDACDKILAAIGNVEFRKIVQYLKDGMTDTDNLAVTLPLRRRKAKEGNQGRLADFSRRSTDVTVITAKAIRNLVMQPVNALYDGKRFAVLDMIWLLDKGNAAEMNHLWETMMGQHQEEYYIFTAQPDNEISDWRLYAYSYFCYVNEEHFERPSVLNFMASAKFEPAGITYQATNQYEQYFDAYNVMSESKFADDVLLRYIRMYQILEYFGYRRVLASMTKGNIRENGFVRNLISKINGHSTNEWVEIKNGISDLFPPLATTRRRPGLFAIGEITVQMEAFIKDKLLIPKYVFDDDHLWMVVYKLRNCIVHNKEADFHFTYLNTDVYNEGIDLMRLFIRKFEPEIVRLINDPSITGLEFDDQRVQIY